MTDEKRPRAGLSGGALGGLEAVRFFFQSVDLVGSFFSDDKGEKSHTPVMTFIPRAVFGVTLDESLDVAQIANLPAIVFRCIQYLEAKKADQEEGIYRLSGSSAVIKNLKDRFNMGKSRYHLR
jgi:hypothetical protein